MVRMCLYCILLMAIVASCGKIGPAGFFKKRSPHDTYRQKLEAAGLAQSAMGTQWLAAAVSSLNNPLSVTVPYQETGYFSPQEIRASAMRFTVKRGEKLTVTLSKRPVGIKIYLDLWEYQEGKEPSELAFADTSGNPLVFDADNKTSFILRLQPELLSGGEYTLTISKGPVLAYPVSSPKTNKIGSFFGDGRDEGGRRHEGIDMFSAFRTPVVAAANGVVTSVTQNALGGKVVFMRPENKEYTLYYAHLDSQTAKPGQPVTAGDTLGLMGNTGNARTTPPHLHFGIYSSSGAIDPLPFVDLPKGTYSKITTDINRLGASLIASRGTIVYVGDRATTHGVALTAQTPFTTEAATGEFYKVRLPDNSTGFIASKRTGKPTGTEKLAVSLLTPVFDRPDTSAARKTWIRPGGSVSVIGRYKGFSLVKLDNETVGWIE